MADNDVTGGNMANAGPSSSNNRRSLAKVVPHGGFGWRGHTQILSRMSHDVKVQSAMREHGGPDFRFNRTDVTTLLVQFFNCLEDALLCNDENLPNHFIALTSAIAVVQEELPWVNALSVPVVYDMISEVLLARVEFLKQNPDLDEDAEFEGTHALRLIHAVDDMGNTLGRMHARNNWAGRGDEENIADRMQDMSTEDVEHGLPPLQVIENEEDAANAAKYWRDKFRKTFGDKTVEEVGAEQEARRLAYQKELDEEDDMAEEDDMSEDGEPMDIE